MVSPNRRAPSLSAPPARLPFNSVFHQNQKRARGIALQAHGRSPALGSDGTGDPTKKPCNLLGPQGLEITFLFETLCPTSAVTNRTNVRKDAVTHEATGARPARLHRLLQIVSRYQPHRYTRAFTVETATTAPRPLNPHIYTRIGQSQEKHRRASEKSKSGPPTDVRPGQPWELEQRAAHKLNSGEPDGMFTGGRQPIRTTASDTNAVLGPFALTPFTRPASARADRRGFRHPQAGSVSRPSSWRMQSPATQPTAAPSTRRVGCGTRLRRRRTSFSSACSSATKPFERPAARLHALSPVTPPPGPATADGAGDDASWEHREPSLPASWARPPPPAEEHPPPSGQKCPR